MSSNESKLLRAAFIPTFLTSGFAILISTLVRGLPGFLGAVLAQFVVIIFFIIHIAVSRMTRNLDPISTMAMALFSYFAKLFALGLLLSSPIAPPLIAPPLESPQLRSRWPGYGARLLVS
jgi:ATP synthase protein I